jgi:hypothetical protein
MDELDRGHKYTLRSLDGDYPQTLAFVKREGPGFPGNVGSYPGTTCQEVIRVLIARVKYLDNQIACEENIEIIEALRKALFLFESRAARRHDRELNLPLPEIENEKTCVQCGHIQCDRHL